MQTPAPSVPEAATPTAVPTVTVVGLDGTRRLLRAPASPEEVAGLRAQRRELNSQLSSVNSRRSDLSRELATTGDPAARAGLEQRIKALDQRSLQIESDLAAVNQQITATPPGVMSIVADYPPGTDDFPEGVLVGGSSVFFAMMLAMFFLRRRRRRNGKRAPASTGAEDSPRLQRVEQAVDAIALEVERISEGQRFVTKLLSESAAHAGAQRIAAPVPADTSKAV